MSDAGERLSDKHVAFLVRALPDFANEGRMCLNHSTMVSLMAEVQEYRSSIVSLKVALADATDLWVRHLDAYFADPVPNPSAVHSNGAMAALADVKAHPDYVEPI